MKEKHEQYYQNTNKQRRIVVLQKKIGLLEDSTV